MKLADYLKEKDLTGAEFATRIGRSPSTVSRIARGLHAPDWPTMLAIKAATNDAVRPEDLAPGQESAA